MNTKSLGFLLPLSLLTLSAGSIAQDLRPTDLSCTPSNFKSGQTVTLKSTIKNIGLLKRAGRSTGAYYLSKDILFGNGDDIRLATFPTPALDRQISHKNTMSVKMPSEIVTRTYYIFVKADIKDAVKETLESNNERRILVTGTATDLKPVLVVPLQLTAGAEVQVSLTVNNLGTLQSAPTTAAFFLSPDAQLTTADVFVAEVNIPQLSGLKSTVLTPKISLPFCHTLYVSAMKGKTTFGVIVNPARTLAESNYTNNNATQERTVAPAPSGRILEWQTRYSSDGLGPRHTQSAKFRLAESGANERMCLTAPANKNQLYLMLWSGNPTFFASDLFTGFSLGSLNGGMFPNWFGVLNSAGISIAPAFVVPKIDVHGFSVYTYHLYFTATGGFTGFGEHRLASSFVQ